MAVRVDRYYQQAKHDMADVLTTDESLNPSLQINQAHGVKIDASNAIRIVTDNVRNGIAMQAGRAQSAVQKANRAAQEKISKVAGRAQGAVDGVIADVGANISGTIESAIAPLIELGVELPSERQIQEIKRQLIVPTQPAQVKPLPGTQQLPMTCKVHELPEPGRDSYRVLARLGVATYFVVPIEQVPLPIGGAAIHLRTFPNWWSAELACRLLTECKVVFQRLIHYWRAIDAVQLTVNDLGAWMKPFCDSFFVAADMYLAWLDAQSHAPPDTTVAPMHSAGNWYRNPVNGECLAFTEVQPPVGWERC